jgi:glycosyltransferase involved in cell wall biosynthesis
VGLVEVGDFTSTLSRGLRELGASVHNVVWETDSPLLDRDGRGHDRQLRRKRNAVAGRAQRFVEFARQASTCDVFVFSYSSFFTNGASSLGKDLKLLKRLGKKVVVVVMGSDLRSSTRLIEQMRTAGLHELADFGSRDLDLSRGGSDDNKRHRAAVIERYADHIFARPAGSQLLSRPCHLLWLPIVLEGMRFELPTSGSPIVVHAPSHRGMKGTQHVLDAVARLDREGYGFDFRLCEGMRNPAVRELLSASQIVVDQLLLPGYGLFAIEAMASGNAVIGSAVPGFNGFGADMPILSSTPSSVYDNLRLLLDRPDLRRDLAVQGRAYVENQHDHRVVARNFVTAIDDPLAADAAQPGPPAGNGIWVSPPDVWDGSGIAE